MQPDPTNVCFESLLNSMRLQPGKYAQTYGYTFTEQLSQILSQKYSPSQNIKKYATLSMCLCFFCYLFVCFYIGIYSLPFPACSLRAGNNSEIKYS